MTKALCDPALAPEPHRHRTKLSKLGKELLEFCSGLCSTPILRCTGISPLPLPPLKREGPGSVDVTMLGHLPPLVHASNASSLSLAPPAQLDRGRSH